MKGLLLAILVLGTPMVLLLVVFRSRDETPPQWSAPETTLLPGTPRSPANARKRVDLPDPPAVQPLTSQPSIADLLEAAEDWFTRETPGEESTAGDDLAARDYPRALRAFDRLLVRRPDDPALLLGKGMALAGLGRHEDALPLFQSAAERRPGDASALFNLGVTLARLGETDAAMATFENLLELHPRHLRGRFNLATLLQARGDNRGALRHWCHLTDSPPPASQTTADAGALLHAHLAAAWSHRGECALRLNLLNQAQASFRKVIELEPADARAWTNLGIAQAASADRASAVQSLEKALQLNPRLVPAMNQLAFVKASLYRDVGDGQLKARVLELCQRSLAIAPVQDNIRHLRFALQHEGDLEPEAPPPAQEGTPAVPHE